MKMINIGLNSTLFSKFCESWPPRKLKSYNPPHSPIFIASNISLRPKLVRHSHISGLTVWASSRVKTSHHYTYMYFWNTETVKYAVAVDTVESVCDDGRCEKMCWLCHCLQCQILVKIQISTFSRCYSTTQYTLKLSTCWSL